MADTDIIDGQDLPEDTKSTEKPARPHKQRRLTLKQRAFVAAYTNPDSPTFGNGTQSVLARPGNGATLDSARAQASDYLANANIQSEIEAIANEAGLSNRFGFRVLKSIADGQYVRRSWTDKETGERCETPKASEVVKALDTAAKMTGRYERNRAMGAALSTRYRDLAKRFRPPVSELVPVVYKSVHPQVVHDVPAFGLLILQGKGTRTRTHVEQSTA